MKIKTKYDIGDRVWYYIEQKNAFAWGKIERIDFTAFPASMECVYTIENRFFDSDYFCIRSSSDYRYHRSLSFKYDEIFQTPEDLKNHLIEKNEEKLSELKELKKGLFS